MGSRQDVVHIFNNRGLYRAVAGGEGVERGVWEGQLEGWRRELQRKGGRERGEALVQEDESRSRGGFSLFSHSAVGGFRMHFMLHHAVSWLNKLIYKKC